MLATAAILCVFETAVAVYIMNRYYNSHFRTMLYLRGHILMAGIYLVILIFLGSVFGGLLVGVRKNGEVLFSHFFTTVFADFAFYVLLMLLSLIFPGSFGALLVGFVLQLALHFAFIISLWSLVQEGFQTL